MKDQIIAPEGIASTLAFSEGSKAKEKELEDRLAKLREKLQLRTSELSIQIREVEEELIQMKQVLK